MKSIKRFFLIAVSLSIVLTGCSGGSSGGSSDPVTSGGVVPPAGIVDIAEIATNISKLYFSSNTSGQAVLWQEVESGSLSTLKAAEYLGNSDWEAGTIVKTGLPSSEISFKRDGIGDIHVAWFTPGMGISARSRINSAWGNETLLTLTGGCLDLESQSNGSGSMMIWCESGGLIGTGRLVNDLWINVGAVVDSNFDTIVGGEPSFDLFNTGSLVAWSTRELADDGVTTVSVLHATQFNSAGNSVNESEVGILPLAQTPFNEIFAGDGGQGLLAWSETSGADVLLFSSVYSSGIWSAPLQLKIAPGGYNEFNAYFLDDGAILLLAKRGGEVGVYHYDGAWSTVTTLVDVVSYAVEQSGQDLFIVHSTATDTQGVTISDGVLGEVFFNLDEPVTDIGLAKLDDSTLLGVWRSGETAFFAEIVF